MLKITCDLPVIIRGKTFTRLLAFAPQGNLFLLGQTIRLSYQSVHLVKRGAWFVIILMCHHLLTYVMEVKLRVTSGLETV
jgi:hypothetical protein